MIQVGFPEPLTTADIICEDVLGWAIAPNRPQVDLIFGSPPYEDLRPYGTGFSLSGEEWVRWMLKVVQALMPRTRGMLALVVEGKTVDYAWSGVPDLLSADLIRAGFRLRKPVAYCRYGIAGASPDYWKNTWEKVIVVTHPGKLPWSDPTACGGPPKYRPGGSMSHRTKSGRRVNDDKPARTYVPPAKTNPGTFFDPEHTGEPGPDKIWCTVGGGHMGHPLAHEGQAPFPVSLASRFISSFCPPGGTVLDPFAGSGSTAHAAALLGRNSISVEIDPTQCDLIRRRLEDVRSRMNPAKPASE